MNRVEFKPPSDFVSEDSSGGNKQIWKWLGIGCGVILLIVGAALAFGAWKTVSCCGQAMDVGKKTIEAQRFAVEFSKHVQGGDYKQAWSMTSAEYRSGKTLEEFKADFENYSDLIANATPRMEGTNARTSEGKSDEFPNLENIRWEVNVHFSPPAGSETLVMFLDVVPKGSGEEMTFQVDAIRFDQRRRRLDSEAPARAVDDFHRTLQRADYEGAYRQMTRGFAKENDVAAFRQFVEEQGDILIDSEISFERVQYLGQKSAEVEVLAVTDADKRATITYGLKESGKDWRIDSIRPIVEEKKPDGTSEADAGSAGSNDAASADEEQPEQKEGEDDESADKDE